MKRLIYIPIILLTTFLVSSFSPKFKPIFGVRTVVIDAGHGGKDPGCHGSKYKEKDVALAVALKLGKYIEDHLKDVKVVYTRKTDVFLELQQRAEIANKAKADLFICIHCNSACYRDKKLKKDICKDEVHGAETYVMGIKNEQGKLDVAKRENSAILLEDNYVQKYDGFDPNSDESYIIMSMFTDTYLNQSLSFAQKVQTQFKTKAGRTDKGVKRASLWVLWRTYMPSVLTEIGFLTNPEEEQFLGSTKGQDYIASGLFRAFREYKDEIEGTVKKYDDNFEKQETYKLSKEDSMEVAELRNALKPAIKEDSNKDSAQSKADFKEIIADKKEEKKEEKKDVVEKKNMPIVYKVQIASSDKKIPLDSDKFKGVEKPGEYQDKGIYKYTAGEYSNQSDAVKLQSQLRKQGFKDAFVIAMQDNKRVPLK
ncbi:MAG: N-acetylmuramoyl-L-alanine amidase [Bacteroidetes bacterium]|nr:N-acetylmuramoyl-L-alanine amidase [Bacteroidota bacterium]